MPAADSSLIIIMFYYWHTFTLSARIGQKKPHTLCCGGINYSYIPAGLQAVIDLSIKTLIYNSITGRRDWVHNSGKIVSGSPVEARATTATISTSLIFTHAEEQRRDGLLLCCDGKNRHGEWSSTLFVPRVARTAIRAALLLINFSLLHNADAFAPSNIVRISPALAEIKPEQQRTDPITDRSSWNLPSIGLFWSRGRLAARLIQSVFYFSSPAEMNSGVTLDVL